MGLAQPDRHEQAAKDGTSFPKLAGLNGCGLIRRNIDATFSGYR